MQGFDQKLGAGETPLAAVTEGGSTMLQDAELKPAVLCMTAGVLLVLFSQSKIDRQHLRNMWLVRIVVDS